MKVAGFFVWHVLITSQVGFNCSSINSMKGDMEEFRQDKMKSNNVSDPELISTEDWWLVSVDMFSSQLKTPKKKSVLKV